MIYFDNAATTFPKPSTVTRAMIDGIEVYGGNPGRGGHALSLQTGQMVFNCRQKVANLFHASLERVIFTANCTQSVNYAIKGIAKKGAHFICSELDHNAILRPLETMQNKGFLTYSIASVDLEDQNQTVRNFEAHITPNTKAIVCTHASNVLGTILPIRALGALCKKHGLLLIVDAAQTAGVFPIDLQQDGIDLLCTAGHKGLYGPTGTGLLLLSDHIDVTPILEGGTGSLSTSLVQPDFYPDRLESGTLPSVGICGLSAGIDFLKKRSIELLYAHEYTLCKQVFDGLSLMPQYQCYQPTYHYGAIAPIVLFNHRLKSSAELSDLLDQRGYCLRAGLHCAPLAHKKIGTLAQGAVRFSPGAFSHSCETQQFLSDLSAIL